MNAVAHFFNRHELLRRFRFNFLLGHKINKYNTYNQNNKYDIFLLYLLFSLYSLLYLESAALGRSDAHLCTVFYVERPGQVAELAFGQLWHRQV